MSEEIDDPEMFSLRLSQAAARVAQEDRRPNKEPQTPEQARAVAAQRAELVRLAKTAALVIGRAAEGTVSLVQKDVAVGRVGAIASQYLDKLANPLRAILAKCESEIELLFLIQFLAPTKALDLRTPADLRSALGDWVSTPPSATSLWCHMIAGASLPEPAVPVGNAPFVYSARPVPLWIVPQYEVPLGGKLIRVDFAIIPVAGTGVLPYAVELDGHQWHERTPDQATKDNSRDRAMLAAGWQTLRFTGKEVMGDPAVCVDQVRAAAFWESLRRDPAMAAKYQKGAA